MTAASRTPPLACVIGDMDLVMPLGLAGIPCAVAAPPGSPPTHSRFVRATIPWTAEMPEAEKLAALLRFGAARADPPVLFCQDDASLLLVSRHRERLAPLFRFLLAGQELVEDLVDKGRFMALAERLGLRVPATRRVRPATEAPPGGLRFPVVVKPLTRDAGWSEVGGSAKALRAETPSALRNLWPALAAAGGELLVQELVPGPEARIESHHLLVDGDGAIAAEFTGRKIRTLPLELGHSTALEISDAPDVAALGREVAARLGLRGVAKLDFKRAPDGSLHLLEVNPRFSLWHHLGAVAGMNIPALVHAGLTGRPRPPIAPPRVGATWCRPTEDWKAAREAGLAAPAWLAWMLRCDANASFALRDPMPGLVGEMLNRLRRGVGGALRRGASRAARDLPARRGGEAA